MKVGEEHVHEKIFFHLKRGWGTVLNDGTLSNNNGRHIPESNKTSIFLSLARFCYIDRNKKMFRWFIFTGYFYFITAIASI